MGVTVVKISQKLWSRTKESRWTILYISFAICQMIISMIIEAVVLRLNGETAQNLSNLNQYHQNPPKNFSYMNYTYANYLAQYNSIIDGNIWFMVFEAFLTALCVSSLYFQNTIEIMSIGIINICLLLFSCIQVFQSFKWIKRINFQIQLDSAEIANFPTSQGQLQQSVVYAELVQLAFLTFFAAASIFFGYKLYGQFGWKIYKKIGADIHTQSMYRTYLIFVLLMKLDVFLLLGFQILNLVFLFGDPTRYTHTIVFQSVCIAIVIPTLGIGLWGVRSENKPAMFVYATLSIATVVNFLYILATFIIKRDESLLTFLDILGIALIVLSLFIAYLAYNNFDNGLKEHFQRSYEGVGNPEDKYRRFAIDEDD